ncbi:MAG: response regulator [Notoacmeibacter sp.]|nr:response regulator [Notoacmeibacter sp.]
MSLSQSLSVLVVDDHITSRMLTVEALQSLNVKNITIAKNGKDGFAKAINANIHLVITDLHMPEVDGLQLLKAIRSHKNTSRMGVIILTGSSDPKMLNMARQLGANNVMSKPFSVPQLKTAVEAVVGRLN